MVAFTNVLVGPNGLLHVTRGTSPGLVFGPSLTLAFGTIDATAGDEVAIGSAAGSIGAVDVAGSDMTALGTIRGNVALDFGTDVQASGSAPGALLIDGNVRHGPDRAADDAGGEWRHRCGRRYRVQSRHRRTD